MIDETDDTDTPPERDDGPDMSLREVAAALGVNPTTAMNIERRAAKRFRRNWKRLYGYDSPF